MTTREPVDDVYYTTYSLMKPYPNGGLRRGLRLGLRLGLRHGIGPRVARRRASVARARMEPSSRADAATSSNASSSNASSSSRRRDAVGARVCVGVLTFDDARESRREVPVRRDSRRRARDGRD